MDGGEEELKMEKSRVSMWFSLECSGHLLYDLHIDVSVTTLTDFTPQKDVHSQRYRLPSWHWTPWQNHTACRSQRRPVSWALLLCTVMKSQVYSQVYYISPTESSFFSSGRGSMTGSMYSISPTGLVLDSQMILSPWRRWRQRVRGRKQWAGEISGAWPAAPS